MERPLLSMPRFLLPLFPAFWGWPWASNGCASRAPSPWLAGAVGLGVLGVLTVNWYYIF